MRFPPAGLFTVLGIDQSLACTGVAAIRAGDEAEIHFVQSRTVVSHLTGIPRVEEILLGIKHMVATHSPHLVVMEDFTRMAKSASLSVLIELAAAIKLDLYRLGLPPVVMNQSSMKKFSFGDGSTKKDSGYMLKVFDVCGLRFSTDDEADAYLHARMLALAVQVCRFEVPLASLKAYQRETLMSRSKSYLKLTDARFKKLSEKEQVAGLEGYLWSA